MPVIFNRGRKIGDKTVARKIQFPKAWDKDGHPIRTGKTVETLTLEPGKSMDLTDQQYKHLKAIFHDEIVNVEDMKELQAQLPQAATKRPDREAYVPVGEVDALVEKRAQELADERSKDAEGKKTDGGDDDKKEPLVVNDALIAKLDGMDKNDVIAFIEANKLDVVIKGKKIDELKGAILTAIENKTAKDAA